MSEDAKLRALVVATARLVMREYEGGQFGEDITRPVRDALAALEAELLHGR